MLEDSMPHFGCRDDQVFVGSNGLTLRMIYVLLLSVML